MKSKRLNTQCGKKGKESEEDKEVAEDNAMKKDNTVKEKIKTDSQDSKEKSGPTYLPHDVIVGNAITADTRALMEQIKDTTAGEKIYSNIKPKVNKNRT